MARFPDANPNPVLRVDPEGFIMYANYSCASVGLFNCTEGEFLPEQYRGIIRETLETGMPRTVEVKGGDLTFLMDLVPVPEQRYVNVYGSNITRRRRMELELRQSQIDLNHAQEVAHTGSWRINIRSNTLTWSLMV